MLELTDGERAGLAGQRALFDSVTADAEELIARGELSDAAAYVELAARFAWLHHTGLHASERLEAAIETISSTALDPVELDPQVSADGRERVLHVLTEGYDVGGHTRVARRWIERDERRQHSLALTGRTPLCPPWLPQAVAESGGTSVRLDSGGTGLLDRARLLRTLASSFHYVVLHVHPFDVVSALAFAGGSPRPPVAMKNHADHVFWLGHGSYDVLACYREGGLRIAHERRGVARERCTILRLPLDLPDGERPTRESARAALGIPAEARVILTIGSRYKYLPIGGPTLADAVAPALDGRDDTLLLVVGPRPDEAPWNGISQLDTGPGPLSTGGRVVVTGPVPDVAPLLAAADVYLEAYPCAGTTTLVDVGAAGLPVLTFCPDRVEAELLGTGHPDIPDARVVACDERELAREIDRLLADPGARAAAGSALRDEIETRHSGEQWSRSLEDVYAKARELATERTSGADVAARASADETGREDAILYRLAVSNRPDHPLEHFEQAQRVFALAAGSTALRNRLAGPLSGQMPPRPDPFPAVLAAPAVEPTAIQAVVDDFRELAAAGYASRFVLTVAPEQVDESVPLIEAALSAGRDVDIDLVPVADPREVLDPAWLELSPAR